MSYTRDYDTTSPIDHTLNRDWPLNDRKRKIDIAERLTAMLYGFASGETDAGVKSLRFIAQGSNPGAVANVFQLFGKEVATRTELHLVDEEGNATQITSLNKLYLDNGRLTNNVYLKAINAAGNGTIDLIKSNASDVAVVPDGSQMATSAAPTADAGIANKKYADDKIKFVLFNGSGGASITASRGVSGVVRNAPGDYTITFNTAFSNANFFVGGGASDRIFISSSLSRSTTTCRIFTRLYDGTGTASDDSFINVMATE